MRALNRRQLLLTPALVGALPEAWALEGHALQFPRDAGSLQCHVEAILHVSCRQNNARTIAMPAKYSLAEIALLDVRGQSRARSAPLDVDNDKRDLGHGSPANRFSLERNAGTA